MHPVPLGDAAHDQPASDHLTASAPTGRRMGQDGSVAPRHTAGMQGGGPAGGGQTALEELPLREMLPMPSLSSLGLQHAPQRP